MRQIAGHWPKAAIAAGVLLSVVWTGLLAWLAVQLFLVVI